MRRCLSNNYFTFWKCDPGPPASASSGSRLSMPFSGSRPSPRDHEFLGTVAKNCHFHRHAISAPDTHHTTQRAQVNDHQRPLSSWASQQTPGHVSADHSLSELGLPSWLPGQTLSRPASQRAFSCRLPYRALFKVLCPVLCSVPQAR